MLEFALRYDPQPFHIDHEAAKKSPYEGIITSGWQTCSFVMRTLVDNYFSPVSSLGSPRIEELRWIIPVRPGDKLMARATIIETKCSRSNSDRAIVGTFIETKNHYEDLVMSFRSVNFCSAEKVFQAIVQTELLSYPLPAFLVQRLNHNNIIMRMSPVELDRNQHHA